MCFCDDWGYFRWPYHVREVAAPCGIDPGWYPENVCFYFVDFRAGEDAANLHFLSESDHVRAGVLSEMLVAPKFTGKSNTGLHFIIHQEAFVLIGQLP